VPILGYFAVTAPMLLSALLLISEYLEPNRADNIAYQSGPGGNQICRTNDEARFTTLRARPIH